MLDPGLLSLDPDVETAPHALVDGLAAYGLLGRMVEREILTLLDGALSGPGDPFGETRPAP